MKRPRVKAQGAGRAKDPRVVGDIIVNAILSKPRMSLHEAGRNHVVPLGPKHRREVASMLRKAHSLLSDWLRDDDRNHIVEAGQFVKRAIVKLETT